MKDDLKDKKRLLRSILTGNMDEARRIKAQKIEQIRGSVIFAKQNIDGTWTITAPCMGWIQNKVKTLTQEKYDKMIEEYEFQVLDVFLYPLEPGKYKNNDGKFVHEETGKTYKFEEIKALADDRLLIVIKMEGEEEIESISVSYATYQHPGIIEIIIIGGDTTFPESEDEIDLSRYNEYDKRN